MYGLLGKKLSHSFSPQIHQKIDNYEYKLFEKQEQDIEDFILSKDYEGLNITIPYKKTVMQFCDELSDRAKKIGCINTIVNKNGKLYGDNTDYYGLLSMFKSVDIDIKDKKVLILGDGATSNTTTIVLQDEKAKEIIKATRKKQSIILEENLNKLDFINNDVKFTNYDEYDIFKDCDIIINCTPVGMYPDNLKTLVDLDKFTNLQAVCDVIYNPLNTKLILDAKQKNIKTSDGIVMLVSQAIYAARLFTGKDYFNLGKKLVNSLKKQMSNIVLIGMPGSGKTSIGKKLSKLSGKKFVDIDELIKNQEGMEISEIFEKFKEPYFREKEKQMILKVSKEHNQIIATGGGCILDEENYFPLKQNSIICYIDRKLNELSVKGRPLSAGGIKTIEKLYDFRYPLYRKFADFSVKNVGVERTAYKIMEGYNENFSY